MWLRKAELPENTLKEARELLRSSRELINNLRTHLDKVDQTQSARATMIHVEMPAIKDALENLEARFHN